MPGWQRRARTSARSSPQWGANYWASSGPSESRLRPPISSQWRHDEQRSNKSKSKNFPKNGKTKNAQPMNSAIQFEDRASSSRSKHEGESSFILCDRLSRTRDLSQRQLPTDHDYAVPTREYQIDQSSLNPAPTAACPVLEGRKKNNDKNKNNPTDVQRLTGSLHIRMEGNRKDLSERERVVSLCAPDPYYHVGFFELNKRI